MGRTCHPADQGPGKNRTSPETSFADFCPDQKYRGSTFKSKQTREKMRRIPKPFPILTSTRPGRKEFGADSCPGI
jgi:hypothetical protein